MSGYPAAKLLVLVALAGGAQHDSNGWLGPDDQPLPFSNDAEVVDFLRTADVVSTEEIGGSQNRPLKVLLEKDGVQAHAVFRSVDKIWRRSWIRGRFYVHLLDRATSEVAAYEMAKMLGLDLIPPAIERSIDGRDGTLQLWLEGAMTHAQQISERLAPPDNWVRQYSTIWVFDNLVYNNDRSPSNIMIDSFGKVWMIDHTQAFQYNDRLLDVSQVQSIGREVWERLRSISDDEIRSVLAAVLDEDQLNALIKRRQRLLDRIDQQIAERGADRVLF